MPVVVFTFSKKKCEEAIESLKARDLLTSKEKGEVTYFKFSVILYGDASFSLHFSIYLSIHLSIVLYFERKNSIFLSLFLYLFLSLSLSLYLSLSIYLSIDLSHTLTHFLFFYPMLLSPCVLFCLTLFRSSFLWEA